jgi:hypothetical protein
MFKYWFNFGFKVVYDGKTTEHKDMMNKQATPIARSATPTLGFFDTVPEDVLNFGIGKNFDAKRVPDMLKLKNEDVSRIASVSKNSVRYDDLIPEQVRERLEEIGMTINMVAKVFDGDAEKTAVWFRARNPMLGDVAPRDMIRLGRFERLRKYIIGAMSKNDAVMRHASKSK